VGVADVSPAVDEVLRRPIAIAPRRPCAVLVVERYWILDVERVDGALDVPALALEGELRRVDADDDEPSVSRRAACASS
jgi:hypothetical protein